jgi:cob(I)alamin adenosyltransferase
MAKHFTRSGDDGYTGRLGEGRLPKYHPVIEAVGTLDEASACLGIARSLIQSPGTKDLILFIQRDLYWMMAEVSATEAAAPSFRKVDESRVTWLEDQIELLGRTVEMPADFILPGDTFSGAAIALARTVVRKAERQVVYLQEHGEVRNPNLVRYLNRLSSLCFILELFETLISRSDKPTIAKDVPW